MRQSHRSPSRADCRNRISLQPPTSADIHPGSTRPASSFWVGSPPRGRVSLEVPLVVDILEGSLNSYHCVTGHGELGIITSVSDREMVGFNGSYEGRSW